MIPVSRAANLTVRCAVMGAVIALLSACAHPTADRVHASAATRSACRARADEVYLKQNRAEIYQADTYATATRDSPYGAGGLPGITTNGLSGRYAREQLEDDCINAADGDSAQVTNPAPTARPPASGIARGAALPPPRP